MVKLFTFWNRRLEMGHDDAVKLWLDEYVPAFREALGPACPRYIANIGLTADFSNASSEVGAWPDMAPPYDGIGEAYLDVETPDEALEMLRPHAAQLAPIERSFAGITQQMVTDEHMQQDVGRRHEGVKFFVLLTRRRDFTFEQCTEHWLNNHGPLVVRVTGHRMARYSINLGQVADYTGWSPTEAPPYDGLAEFSFDCDFAELSDIVGDHPEIIPDERRFIGTYRIINVDERVVADAANESGKASVAA